MITEDISVREKRTLNKTLSTPHSTLARNDRGRTRDTKVSRTEIKLKVRFVHVEIPKLSFCKCKEAVVSDVIVRCKRSYVIFYINCHFF